MSKTAIVTGASQGIGKGVALGLVKQGIKVFAASRRMNRLKEIQRTAAQPSHFIPVELDLSEENSILNLIHQLKEEEQVIDLLVLNGGYYFKNSLQETLTTEMIKILHTNVTGNFLLLKNLVPFFNATISNVVVVNSTLALTAKGNVGAFGASVHGLKAITDSFRAEHNANNIKVTSLYLGRTASPRMEDIYANQNATYKPELLLQPSDIADIILNIINLTRNVEITDLQVRSFIKSY